MGKQKYLTLYKMIYYKKIVLNNKAFKINNHYIPPSIISNFLSLSRIILDFQFLQNKLHEQVLHKYINMDCDVYPF